MALNVGIVGGGLGGLCLAQGLRKAGVKVTVYEREKSRTDRLQGFRINIDPRGSKALRECLPDDTWNAFVESCGVVRGGFQMGDEQLRPWLKFGGDSVNDAEVPKSVSRITLRQVLLLGLDDMIHFGKEFKEYEVKSDSVVLKFADGTTYEHDVVVGADGTNSRIRKQFLPGNDPFETGVIAIAAKAPLNENNSNYLHATMCYAPHGWTFAMVRHQPQKSNIEGVGVNDEDQMKSQPGLLFDNTVGYFFWVLLARKPKWNIPFHEFKEGSARLKTKALEVAEKWHPNIKQLIKDTEVPTLALWDIRTSKPTPPWETTRITLLGDAIHTMSPTGGMGAVTALRDATLLCKKLTEANKEEKPLLVAIHEYEDEMRAYANIAVIKSRGMLDKMVQENPWKRMMMKWILRTINLLPSRVKYWFMQRSRGQK